MSEKRTLTPCPEIKTEDDGKNTLCNKLSMSPKCICPAKTHKMYVKQVKFKGNNLVNACRFCLMKKKK